MDAQSPSRARPPQLRSGLKFSHLRFVAALEESASVSAAAASLNISQPAASRMLSEIEGQLGVPVCERLARGVTITPFGRSLARRSRAILLELSGAERELQDLKHGVSGSVSLGSVSEPAVERIFPSIRSIRSSHPDVAVSIQVETSPILIRELIAARLDFVISRIPDELDARMFSARMIGEEHATILCRQGHPLAGRAGVSLEELQNLDWVFQPSGSLLRKSVEAEFQRRNLELPGRRIDTSSLLMTLLIVAGTDAVAPMATAVAQFLVGASGLGSNLVILDGDFDIRVQAYSLITVKGRSLAPAAQLLYDQILSGVADAENPPAAIDRVNRKAGRSLSQV